MFAAPPAELPPLDVPPGFSIADIAAEERFRMHRPCPSIETGEIVICGRRDDGQYRLDPSLFRGTTPMLPTMPLAVDLAPNLRASLIADQIVRFDGFVDQRVMVTFRLRF